MSNIIFNGRSYSSIDEMPATERMAYEQMMNIFVDKNGNGIPDFMEGDVVQNVMSAYSSRVDVNGQTVRSLDDLPPEVRQSVNTAFQVMSNLGLIPAVPAEFQNQNQPVSREPMATSKPFVSREYNPTIQEEKSNTPLIVVLIGLVLLLCLGAAGVLIFLQM
ncbi:MAG: hypothetical protein FJ031_14025 [Chloroflexi bacterium]|nr:hypothetical protein [Chloroflexota bacterium]